MNTFPQRPSYDTAEAPALPRLAPATAELLRAVKDTPSSRDAFSPRNDRLPLGRQLELTATTRHRT